MEKGLISVLMGIYNIPSKEVLEKSIDSILNQTYSNIEFIIIDDGSTNNTFKWAKEIADKDSRIVLLQNKENIGLTKTLNKCLKYAHGEYIARMDGDDYCDLQRFEKQVKFLKDHPEYDLVGCNLANFDENGIWGERIVPEIVDKKDFLFTSPVPHPTLLTYKRCFNLVNGYRETWKTNRNEDYDLFMRMFASGIRMYNMQEKLYYYREDKNCYSKRKYKYRICEMFVRAKGFWQLKLYPIGIPYVIKPLIIGLVPQMILRKMRNRKKEEK